MQTNHLISISNEFSMQQSSKKPTYHVPNKYQYMRDSNKGIVDKLNSYELSQCDNQQMQLRLLTKNSAQNGNRRTKESDELANLLMRRQEFQKKTQPNNIQTVDYEANISNSDIKAASQTIDIRLSNVTESIIPSLPSNLRDRRSKTTVNKINDKLSTISNSFSSRFQGPNSQEYFRAKCQSINQTQQEQTDLLSSIVIPVKEKEKIHQRQWNPSYQIKKELLNMPSSPVKTINICNTYAAKQQQQSYFCSLSCKNSPSQLDSKNFQKKIYARQRRLVSETKTQVQQQDEIKSENQDDDASTVEEDKLKVAPEVASNDPQIILKKCEISVQKSIKLMKRELKEEKGVNDVVKAFEEKQGREDIMKFCCIPNEEIQTPKIIQQNPSRSYTPNNMRQTQNVSLYSQNMHSKSYTTASNSPSKLAQISPFRVATLLQETSPTIKISSIIMGKQSFNDYQNSYLMESKGTQINSLVQSLRKQSQLQSKQPPLNQFKTESVVLPKQSILKEKIKESLKRIEKCLDFSAIPSEQQTIQLDQTPLITEKPKIFELFITSEYQQKTATMLINEKNHEFIVVPILLAEYSTLPFDLRKIEKFPDKFKIGEGSSGKVFKIQLGWNKIKSQNNKEGQTQTNQPKEEQDPFLQALNQQLFEQTQQYVAVKVLKYYDEQCLAIKSNELIIEKYLAEQQYRHLCNIQPPTYFMDKKGYSELFIVQDLGDFNLQKVLDKRRRKFFSYSERELLQIAKAFIVQTKNKNQIVF